MPNLTQPNYTCWLNEHSQRNRLSLHAEESTLMEQGCATPCCRFVLDGRAYPTACGRNKKDAKEEAAKLAYKEIVCDLPSKDVNESCNVESCSQPRNELRLIADEMIKVKDGLEVSITKERRSLTEPNFIGIINHYCQKTSRSLDFSMVRRGGLPHCPQFFFKVVIGGKEYPEVEGKTAREAKHRAAQVAWATLKEQSDWDSKVSVKSAMSEEEATSNTAPTERESLNSTSSGGILFKDTSEPPKEEKLDVKPKIKLAARFQNAPKEHSKEDEIPNFKIQNPPTENSRFLNDFDEFERLGKGGYGRVYKARLKLLSEYYAVKIVCHKLKALQEAKVLATLDHRNIVRYFSVWSEQSEYNYSASESSSTSQSSTDWSGPYLYIQMELCEKKNLEVWIDERNVTRRDPARQEDSRAIMQKIVCGVEYIHLYNLIHRDLKPLNIMFASNGEVKIGDFGLVTKDIDDTAGEKTRKAGTKSFMAPEQKDIINSMLQESPGDRPHAKDVTDKLRFDILQQSQSA
ncbi:hypothetical protein CRUP_002888 [Coryphaenoides rupestris]|nr:hypothetical protein CRUP_002888 [Coryphaenoides rupestris]